MVLLKVLLCAHSLKYYQDFIAQGINIVPFRSLSQIPVMRISLKGKKAKVTTTCSLS